MTFILIIILFFVVALLYANLSVQIHLKEIKDQIIKTQNMVLSVPRKVTYYPNDPLVDEDSKS